jgi:hypothetical protein
MRKYCNLLDQPSDSLLVEFSNFGCLLREERVLVAKDFIDSCHNHLLAAIILRIFCLTAIF